MHRHHLARTGRSQIQPRFFPAYTNPGSGPFPAVFQAYQANGTRDALFQNNTCAGGVSGFYTDTFSETNLTIADNLFRNVVYGVLIIKGAKWNVDGVAIKNNVIEINTNRAEAAIFIRNDDKTGTVTYQNVSVSSNTLCYYNQVEVNRRVGASAVEAGAAADTNFRNLRIVGNIIDRSFAFSLNATGICLEGNIDPEGVPLDARLVGAGSAGTVQLNPVDGFVCVRTTDTTNLTLPPARGYPGKEVTVVHEKETGILTISPLPGERMTPLNPTILSSNATVRFISDGSNHWMKQ